MRIIGCDLHVRQETLAMLDTTTGEMVNRTLMHEGNKVREFYSELPRPVLDAATRNVLASQYSVDISRRLVFSQDGRFLYGTSPFTAFDPDTLAVIATLPTLVGTRAAIDDTELVFTPDNTLACTFRPLSLDVCPP